MSLNDAVARGKPCGMDHATYIAAATGFATGFSLILAIGAQNAFVLRQGLRGVGRVLLDGHRVVGGEEREQSDARGEDVRRRALRRRQPHLTRPR